MASFLYAPAPPPNAAHSWPQPQATILLTIFFTLWFYGTSTEGKLRGLLGAGLFSVTEYVFYTITIEEPDGTIKMRPFDKRCRKGHTTVHQFFANVLSIPFFIDGFMKVVPFKIIKVLLFPFDIWLMEIVQGYTFIYLYGVNPAWIYRGPEALFHGTINIGYFGYWLGMGGAVVYLAYPYLVPLLNGIV